MVSADLVRTVVGITGNIISLLLFMSPVPTFVQIWRKKSVEQFSPAPYLATLINCMAWVLYGLPMVHPNSTLVWTINGTGVAIEMIYLLLFLIYSDKKRRFKVLQIVLVEVVSIALLATLVLTLVHTTKKRTAIVGIVAIVFNTMMYASPLSVMKIVITTKSVEYMPFYISLASFANGVAWSAYAFIKFDPFILAPNGTGALFAVAQLILYAVYYRSTQRQIAARQAKGDVGLSELVVN
ncbi:PREDICTED: bidirectional sugar transporter SWEET4 [Populus euphratica]|uniref:Bidirectional sugar transporter SWEET n=1 Tax=Populus euphratica TaxID=75702 RepID=A0AAJ6U4K6_POPEU|nr:PREDICTED: bidirectional sugar transporter SWEET4 [Populus euphratica]